MNCEAPEQACKEESDETHSKVHRKSATLVNQHALLQVHMSVVCELHSSTAGSVPPHESRDVEAELNMDTRWFLLIDELLPSEVPIGSSVHLDQTFVFSWSWFDDSNYRGNATLSFLIPLSVVDAAVDSERTMVVSLMEHSDDRRQSRIVTRRLANLPMSPTSRSNRRRARTNSVVTVELSGYTTCAYKGQVGHVWHNESAGHSHDEKTERTSITAWVVSVCLWMAVGVLAVSIVPYRKSELLLEEDILGEEDSLEGASSFDPQVVLSQEFPSVEVSARAVDPRRQIEDQEAESLDHFLTSSIDGNNPMPSQGNATDARRNHTSSPKHGADGGPEGHNPIDGNGSMPSPYDATNSRSSNSSSSPIHGSSPLINKPPNLVRCIINPCSFESIPPNPTPISASADSRSHDVQSNSHERESPGPIIKEQKDASYNEHSAREICVSPTGQRDEPTDTLQGRSNLDCGDNVQPNLGQRNGDDVALSEAAGDQSAINAIRDTTAGDEGIAHCATTILSQDAEDLSKMEMNRIHPDALQNHPAAAQTSNVMTSSVLPQGDKNAIDVHSNGHKAVVSAFAIASTELGSMMPGSSPLKSTEIHGFVHHRR